MQTTVNKNLYDAGYHLEGKGNRVDVVDPEGSTCFEIFFFDKQDILIMCKKGYIWVRCIHEIFIDEATDNGPHIYYSD